MKLCCDCKNGLPRYEGWWLWKREEWEYARCAATTVPSVDPVTGRDTSYRGYCKIEREHTTSACGPNAKLWQPR